MVGNLAFSQHFKLAQLRELNGVKRHRIMKQSTWDHQLGLDSPLRGAFKAVTPKTLRGKRRGWMQSAKFPPLPRGGENISLDIPFYRIPFYRIPSALTILFNLSGWFFRPVPQNVP
jgi:hypothetical protein